MLKYSAAFCGLKTGMYYLRTKSAVDAIKFTLGNKAKEETPVQEKKKETAKKTAQKFSKATEIDVKPMSPEEMKELIAKNKEGEVDDCLMCGS